MASDNRIHAVMQRLVKRSHVFRLLGLAAITPIVWTALAGLVSSTLQNFKGPQTGLSRIQLSTQLVEALNIKLPRLSERELSVLAYVDYGNKHLWHLDVLMVLAVIVVIPLTWAIYLGPLRTAISSMSEKVMVTFFCLLFTLFGGMVLTITLTTTFVHESTGHSTLYARDSRYFPRTTGEEFQAVIARLEDLKQAPDLHLPAQYAIAQLAHRVGADDANAQIQAFLQAYRSDPNGLGYVPIGQHLYALEHSLYGEPRSIEAIHYALRRETRLHSHDGPTRTRYLLSLIGGGLAIVFFGASRLFRRRVSRLKALMTQASSGQLRAGEERNGAPLTQDMTGHHSRPRFKGARGGRGL